MMDADGNLREDFLRYNNDWRNGVRQFQDDLKEGRYEVEWVDEAAEASRARAAGMFDEWKEDQFEEYWGQKTKLTPKEFTAEVAKLQLGDMIAARVFAISDVWSYARPFGRGKQAYLVEKEVKVSTVS